MQMSKRSVDNNIRLTRYSIKNTGSHVLKELVYYISYNYWIQSTFPHSGFSNPNHVNIYHCPFIFENNFKHSLLSSWTSCHLTSPVEELICLLNFLWSREVYWLPQDCMGKKVYRCKWACEKIVHFICYY